MKLTHHWLLTHLNTAHSVQEICNTLVDIGLEVESVESFGASLEGFLFARIIETNPHPQADRLQICMVDVGKGPDSLIQVVCGATNARPGLGVVFANVGSIIPKTGQVLKKGVIRGIQSDGMLCSGSELNLGTESDGIMEIESEYPLGTSLATILKLDDSIIDVSITPNRGDCWSVRGIARDLSARYTKNLTCRDNIIILPTLIKKNPDIYIECPEFCSLFLVRLLHSTQLNIVQDTTFQEFLRKIEVPLIHPIVDVTNFINFDQGQPLHAYDAETVKGPIRISRAKGGESFEALNNKTYSLPHGAIIISDDVGIISLAGIIGGKRTACTEKTIHILLESAVFDPISITHTAQKLMISTEAKMRFERGIDSNRTQWALEYAAHLIQTYDPTLQVNTISGIGQSNPILRIVELPWTLITRLTGMTFGTDHISTLLESLGIGVEIGSTELFLKIPSWRHDLTTPTDIIEEIVRINGYNLIPEAPLSRVFVPPKKPDMTTHLTALLIALGYNESINFSFISPHLTACFMDPVQNVTLLNPINQDLSIMRRSLMPSLFDVYKKNQVSGRGNQKIFEIAPIYLNNTSIQDQEECCGCIFTGEVTERTHLTPARTVDFYDIKGELMLVLEDLGLSLGSFKIELTAPSYYHPGYSFALTQGKKTIAYCGLLSPHITGELPVAGFEIFINRFSLKHTKKKSASLSHYPVVERDFACILEKSIVWNTLSNHIQKISPYIQKVILFDVYSDHKIQENHESIAFSVTLQAPDRTLTEEDITSITNTIIESVQKLGGEIRH